ncbi:MAG: hypothetical protein AAB490_05075 [Patescibacteria group bacterium]
MTLLVAASNPGGANAVMPVARELMRQHDVVCIIEGTAREVFEKGGVPYVDVSTVSDKGILDLLDARKVVFFLYGSSIGATIEKKLLTECSKRSITSMALVDFWSNYWQRFSTGKKDFAYMPEFICVIDDMMKQQMLDEGFQEGTLLVTGNPFFDHFADGITTNHEDRTLILIISQPLQELEQYEGGNPFGYNEHEVLRGITSILKEFPEFKPKVRLHPRDQKGKYNGVEYDNEDLTSSLSKAGIVIGMNSMVLFQAAIAGKIVISYQPHLKQDVLVSNSMGLSILVQRPSELRTLLRRYADGRLQAPRKADESIIPHATKNVVSEINKLLNI